MTFVYAGSMDEWQCIDKMLGCYNEIQKHFHNCKLSLLTSNKDEALRLIGIHHIENENIEVKYIPLSDIDKELEQYKYAFLLRDDIEVNRVATPTKMNTYLANGLIPIYSDVVDSFRINLSQLKYRIIQNTEENSSSIISKIQNIEKMQIPIENIMSNVEKVFTTYYNRDIYANQLYSKFIACFNVK
jgi:hypothetical protein